MTKMKVNKLSNNLRDKSSNFHLDFVRKPIELKVSQTHKFTMIPKIL